MNIFRFGKKCMSKTKKNFEWMRRIEKKMWYVRLVMRTKETTSWYYSMMCLSAVLIRTLLFFPHVIAVLRFVHTFFFLSVCLASLHNTIWQFSYNKISKTTVILSFLSNTNDFSCCNHYRLSLSDGRSAFRTSSYVSIFSHQNNSIDCWYRPIQDKKKVLSVRWNEKKKNCS